MIKKLKINHKLFDVRYKFAPGCPEIISWKVDQHGIAVSGVCDRDDLLIQVSDAIRVDMYLRGYAIEMPREVSIPGGWIVYWDDEYHCWRFSGTQGPFDHADIVPKSYPIHGVS